MAQLLVVRKLRAARGYTLAELPENIPGCVVGIAHALEKTLTAPLTGRACVYYEVKVVNGSKRGSGRRVVHERRAVPFVLRDGDVHAIVDPEHAELAVDFDRRTTSGPFDDPTPKEAALLARHGRRGRRWIFNKALCYEEAVIAIGKSIAVLGAGVREPDPQVAPTAYRGEQPTCIRISGSRRFPLLISDKSSATKPWRNARRSHDRGAGSAA